MRKTNKTKLSNY